MNAKDTSFCGCWAGLVGLGREAAYGVCPPDIRWLSQIEDKTQEEQVQMISRAYIETMADYNRWQNSSLYDAASNLSDVERRADRGAFFGSIHATLSHLLWGDKTWLSRFGAGSSARKSSIADSIDEGTDWLEMVRERQTLDKLIIEWARGVDETTLGGDLTWYSGAMGREVSKPLGLLITHFFNHQTHHRGQVHAMLTAAGQSPDDTDLPFKPEN